MVGDFSGRKFIIENTMVLTGWQIRYQKYRICFSPFNNLWQMINRLGMNIADRKSAPQHWWWLEKSLVTMTKSKATFKTAPISAHTFWGVFQKSDDCSIISSMLYSVIWTWSPKKWFELVVEMYKMIWILN